MNIGIVGGGINGLCSAWLLACRGHRVSVYERDSIMNATSRASSKLLHGGLRYLENGEFRLVREALRERDAWIGRAPHLAKPLRFVIPIYRNSRRGKWFMAAGLFLYDSLAGKSILPKARRLTVDEVRERDARLNSDGLVGGVEFFDGQMDDYALGLWVAERAKEAGVEIIENAEVQVVSNEGVLGLGDRSIQHDRLINIAGPWAVNLLERSGIKSPYRLDLVRGSHLVLPRSVSQAYLLEVPNERRIFFVLPWKGRTLIGTTEVRQKLDEPMQCSLEEKAYLLGAYKRYFPNDSTDVEEVFAGVRPLLYGAEDPNKATREYTMFHDKKLTTVLGGKWTTSLALARKVTETIQ